jgi:hypothetical protein
MLAACSDDARPTPADSGALADAHQADASDEDAADADATWAACPAELTDDTPTEVAAEINGWVVRVHERTGRWNVQPAWADEAVLGGPGACRQGEDNPQGEDNRNAPVRLASGEPYVENLFGGFKIELESERSGMAWTPPAAVAPEVEQVDGGVVIRWPLADQPNGKPAVAELRFMPEGAANLSIALAVAGENGDAFQGGEIAMHCQPDEAFFGLGSQATGMNLHGRTYPLWTQEQGNGKPEDGGIFPLNNVPEAAYAPMGIWHSTADYSAIIGHDRYSELDICDSSADLVQLRSHGELPRFVLVAGETPRERLTAITEYTGRLDPAPPSWVFGTWLDAVGGAWRIEEVASALRENDISASAIWTEDWIGGQSTGTGYRLSYAWEWDEQSYPNLPATIDELHAVGFAFLGYFNPFVPETVAHFEEGKAQGYLIKNEDGEVYTFSDPAFRTASLWT